MTDPDPPVELDLQQLLQQTFASADYGKTICAESPDPPLAEEDAAWARQFVMSTCEPNEL